MATPQEEIIQRPKPTFLGNAIIVGVIVLALAFFIGAGSGAYDPGHIFKMLFGFVTIGAVVLGVIALIFALITRLGAWLFRRS